LVIENLAFGIGGTRDEEEADADGEPPEPSFSLSFELWARGFFSSRDSESSPDDDLAVTPPELTAYLI
jgi:hypothetical protein